MSNKMALDALKFAEAALADIGDADREPGDDLAWCEARAAEALPRTRAAIAALQAEPQGWGPIETAPKDGSTYLVADAVRGMVAPHIRGVIHNNPGTAHDWQYGEAATHWMPLPTPPKD